MTTIVESWEQTSLIPPSRVKLRLDCAIIGPADRVGVTYTLWDEDSGDLQWLGTFGADLSVSGLAGVEREISRLLREAVERCATF